MAEESAVAASSSSPANSGAFFKTSGSTRNLPDHGTAPSMARLPLKPDERQGLEVGEELL
jgi:hypothetical protein